MTVIEPSPQLMGREDADVAAEMQRILGDEGIEFLLATQAINVDGRSGDDVKVTVRTPSDDAQIAGSDILVAAGRSPNTKEIGLEQAGVALDTRGYVRVNNPRHKIEAIRELRATAAIGGGNDKGPADTEKFTIIIDLGADHVEKYTFDAPPNKPQILEDKSDVDG